MKKIVACTGIAVATLIGLTTPLSASILFSQGLSATPQADFATNSNGPNNVHGSIQQIANRFTPTASGIVTSATWWGSYASNLSPGASTQFVVRFFEGGTLPGALISQSSAVATAENTGLTNANPLTIYKFTASFSGPNLNAGTEYFISILENDVSPNASWGWSQAGSFRSAYQRSGDAGGWSGTLPANAFELHGSGLNAVPEPSTWLIWSLSMISGTAFAARRRKATKSRR